LQEVEKLPGWLIAAMSQTLCHLLFLTDSNSGHHFLLIDTGTGVGIISPITLGKNNQAELLWPHATFGS